MKALGKLLQIAGLVALPLGIFLELTGQLGRAFGVSQLVHVMLFGLVAFYLGRTLEGYASK